MSNMQELIIDVRNLTMKYGDKLVLDNLDLQVSQGEVVVLLGPNGAGKTTTFETLMGFRDPSAGQIKVLGENPAIANETWRAKIGVVLQSWRDHSRWRAIDLLNHTAKFYEPYLAATGQRPWCATELLELVRLGDKANSQIAKLSGGQRRRLDVALGLVGRPQILFLDEPTAGFDPQVRREFHDLIAQLADQSVTIMMTTHDLAEAQAIASRVLILNGGKIIANSSADQMRLQHGSQSEIRWRTGGTTHVHATDNAIGFLRKLLANESEEICDLEVSRASLEMAYLKQIEAGQVSPIVAHDYSNQ